MMRAGKDHRGETGTALITALVIVALMSAATVAVLETLRFGTRISVNLAARDQARLYAIGAEELAAATLQELREEPLGERYPALDLWVQTPVAYPIPGGRIAGRASDGANCLNLNGLVTGSGEGFIANPNAVSRFVRLMERIGISRGEAETLAALVVDWIDSDSRPGFGSAEDGQYVALTPGYRTPGDLMVDVSELRLMRDWDAETYEALAPFLCVRPVAEESVLNLNTLALWQAPLLAAYLGDNARISTAEEIVTDRPVVGYDSVLEALPPQIATNEEAAKSLQPILSLASSYYDLEITVEYREAVIHLTSSLQISGSGNITVVSRRYGTLE